MITLEAKYLPHLHGCWTGVKKALEEAKPAIITDKGDDALKSSALNHAAYENVINFLETLVHTLPEYPDQQFIDPNYEETKLKSDMTNDRRITEEK